MAKTEADYTYPASKQALSFGESYADMIEESTARHVAMGFTHCATQSLGEALSGNDGD